MGSLTPLAAAVAGAYPGSGDVISRVYELEPAGTNLFLHSAAFNNAAWTNLNVTVTANSTLAPNGVVEADTLTNTAPGVNNVVQFPAIPATNLDYVFSVYILAGTSASVQIGVNISGYSFVNVNPTTGQMTFTSADATATVEAVIISGPNIPDVNWFRVSITKPNAFGGVLAQGFVIPNQTGSGTLSVIAWGAQMELGETPSSQIPTAAAQVTRTAGVIPPWLNAGGSLPVVPAAGLILRSDGATWVASQSSYPDIVAAGNVLHATAANTIGSVAGFNYGAAGLAVATGVKGVSGATNAQAGTVGEYIESVVANVNFPATGQLGNATSIALTAGDWDISGLGYTNANGATVVTWSLGISLTTGNSAVGLVNGSNYMANIIPPTATNSNATISNWRLSIAGNTTVYLKIDATFTVATPIFNGRLSARRVQPGA